MKCFSDENEAVGNCKSCCKGLCKSCLTDVGNGIACKDTCVKEVLDINEIVREGKSNLKKMKSIFWSRLIYLGAVFFLTLFFLKWISK